jgi:hypothetical protein
MTTGSNLKTALDHHTTKMENMELLEAIKEIMDAYLKELREEMRAGYKEMMAKLDTHQAKTDNGHEEIKAHTASLNSRIEDNNKKCEVLRDTLDLPDGCPSGKDDGLSRKDGGHRFGCKSRGNAV